MPYKTSPLYSVFLMEILIDSNFSSSNFHSQNNSLNIQASSFLLLTSLFIFSWHETFASNFSLPETESWWNPTNGVVLLWTWITYLLLIWNTIMEKGGRISILSEKCKQSNSRIFVSDFIVLRFIVAWNLQHERLFTLVSNWSYFLARTTRERDMKNVYVRHINERALNCVSERL